MTVLVSLQVPGDPDPHRAHLAAGVLVGPDLVVVPAVPRRVPDRYDSFEVLLVPEKGDPERLPVSHTLIYPAADTEPPAGADGPERALVALVVRLGRPTALPAVEAPLRRAASVLTTLRALLPDAQETAARLEATRTGPEVPYSHDRRPPSGASPVPLADPLSGTHSVEEFSASPGICDWVPWC